MTVLRLIADDLTGALDSAAQFTGAEGPIDVLLEAGEGPPPALRGSLAIDTATREREAAAAAGVLRRTAPWLEGADIAFKKIDSLLRGPFAEEIAACLDAGRFGSCVIAPAFPGQQRVTRRGRQLARDASGRLVPAAVDLVDALRSAGLEPRLAAGAAALSGSGVFVCDAETQDELAAIAVAARHLEGPVLWCGSAGLAAALAGRHAATAAVEAGPLLLVIGSHHPVMQRQVASALERHPGLLVEAGRSDPERTAAALGERLRRSGVAALAFDLPGGLADAEALPMIAERLQALVPHCPRPASLFVSGGETLRALCAAVGCRRLRVRGEVAPGLPAAHLIDGRWSGAPLMSKSGAFGGAGLLTDLIELALSAWRRAG